jgi:hypothetical protein
MRKIGAVQRGTEKGVQHLRMKRLQEGKKPLVYIHSTPKKIVNGEGNLIKAEVNIPLLVVGLPVGPISKSNLTGIMVQIKVH